MRNRVKTLFRNDKQTIESSANEDLNAVIIGDYNALQVASLLGLTQYVLKQLYLGINSDEVKDSNQLNPVQLALCSEHYLIAEILIACGADKNQIGVADNARINISYALIRALIYWYCHQAEQDDPKFLKALQNSFAIDEVKAGLQQDITHFIAYAQQEKKNKLANHLLKIAGSIEARYQIIDKSLDETFFQGESLEVFTKKNPRNTRSENIRILSLKQNRTMHLINNNLSAYDFISAFSEGDAQTFIRQNINLLMQSVVLCVEKIGGDKAEMAVIANSFPKLELNKQYELVRSCLELFYPAVSDQQLENRLRKFGSANYRSQGFERLPRDLNFHIMMFLTPADFSAFKQACHYNDSVGSNPLNKSYEKLLRLGKHHELLQTCLALLGEQQQMVSRKNYNVTLAKKIIFSLLFMAVTAWLITFAIFLSKLNDILYAGEDEGCEGFSHFDDNGYDCETYWSIETCIHLCEQYRKYPNWLATFFGLVGSCIFWFSLVVIPLYLPRGSTNSTVHIVRTNIKNVMIHRFLELLKATEIDANKLDLSFSDLKQHLETLIASTQSELSNLKALFASDKPQIEVNESVVIIDIPEEEKVSPLDASPVATASSSSSRYIANTRNNFFRSALHPLRNDDLEQPLLSPDSEVKMDAFGVD